MDKRDSAVVQGPADRMPWSGAHAFSWRKPRKRLKALWELALDLRWTWSHVGDRLWELMDKQAWELTGNPWLILQTVSERRLDQLSRDRAFQEELERISEERAAYLKSPGWFAEAYPRTALRRVAYFSMEFGLGEGMPLYAGGLGILAGDFLKTASDLVLPMVGVGLLYREGYFRQVMLPGHGQVEFYPHNDPLSLPIAPVVDVDGGWLRVPLELPGRVVLLRVWRAAVGRVALYLLDSDDPLNSPADRGITAKLYEAEAHQRLLQELALGIGGWRALEALKLEVDVCHLNEGHAAFAPLERARSFMERTGTGFSEALWATRAGNIFTTHTPVTAAFDTFSAAEIARQLADYAGRLKVSVDSLIGLGRADPTNAAEPFNMAFLALRTSARVNGVSRLHGEMSRHIFEPLFPRWPHREVPIAHITNGVHVPTWDCEGADELWTRYCGKGCWMAAPEKVKQGACAVSEAELWVLRNQARAALVAYARERLRLQLRRRGASDEAAAQAARVLDPDALTLGFARRFTAYKRPNLLLHDAERLARLLSSTERKVQLVAAGKAHPRDVEGKELVGAFAEFCARSDVRARAIFLEDYDMELAEHLVQGVDLWINTPRRPWEACGTSGMKVLVNGGLNLSELDGWWAEAYTPEVGWAIGDGRQHEGPQWDAREAEQLYEILEKQIIPEFYQRDARGLPARWLVRVCASMAQLAPQFSSNRMLREYAESAYLGAAAAFRARSQKGAALARELWAWQNALAGAWSSLRFGRLKTTTADGRHRLEVEVFSGGLPAEAIMVELYAEPGPNENEPVRVAMRRLAEAAPDGAELHQAEVPAARPAGDYTPRIVPRHPAACVPLEEAHILWFR